MKTIIATLLLMAAPLWAGTNTVNRLEAAVRAGPRIHEVNPAAAKLGERPNAYASPGREKHGKPPPPGQNKKP